MKKIIFSLLALCFVSQLHAQPFSFGLSGGYNRTGMYGTESSTYFSNSSGFNVGAYADYDWKFLTAESGLYYTTSGYDSYTRITMLNDEGLGSIFTAKGKDNLNYLEIPLNILYNFRLPFGKLFVGGGVFLNDGLSGHSKGSYTQTSIPGPVTTGTYDNDAAIGSEGNEFKKVYTGFEGTVGIRFKNRFMVAFKLQGSFVNVYDNATDGGSPGTFKSAAYSLSAGYMFL